MNIELAKAIFAAGFRAGHAGGSDSATAYEWGAISHEPQTAEDYWKRDMDWRFEATTSFDIANELCWKDVP